MRLQSSGGSSIAPSQHANTDPARPRSRSHPGGPHRRRPGAAARRRLRHRRPTPDRVAPSRGRSRPRLPQEPALGSRLGDFRRDRLSFGGETSSRLRAPTGARPSARQRRRRAGIRHYGGHDRTGSAAASSREPPRLRRPNIEVLPLPRDARNARGGAQSRVSGLKRPAPSRAMPRSASRSRTPWDRPARRRGSPPTEWRSPPTFVRSAPPNSCHRRIRPAAP